jgi:heme/copper-type cytochrome/quinol oxidase subunit 2
MLGDQSVIEIIAAADGFKVPGKKKPEITVQANSVVQLRITAEKGEDWRKDGVVHTFTIKKLKEQGWDLMLKEGTQEFTLRAPSQPGKYRVVCKVYCGAIHQDMSMTMIVTP